VIGLRDNPACRSPLPKLTCFKLDLEALGLALSEAAVATLADPMNADFPHLQRRWPMGLELGSSHDSQTSLTLESNVQL
jgi:hypothetical protein